MYRNSDILIFKEETRDGLADLIRDSAFAISCSLLVADTEPVDESVLDGLRSIASDLSLPDLFPTKGILASTGSNLNDDFLLTEEAFTAKDTPANKPFDFEHKSSDIIGHMTGSCLLDAKGNLIKDGDKLPDAFDIGFKGVLYRHFTDDKKKQERTDKIIAALEKPTDEDKWFVSMECRFKGFDYLMYPEGDEIANATLVKRTDDTAFLTKHLRIYKGTGSYKGNKVLRVFRNVTYSGIGLVRQPANPKSVVSTASARITSGKIYSFSKTLGYNNNSEEIMNEIETLKAELAKVKENLDKANLAIAETAKANWEKKTSDFEVVVANLKKEIDTQVANVAAKSGEADVAKAALAKLEDEKKNLVTELDKFKAETLKAEATRIKSERLGKVKEAYNVTDEAKADQIVVTFAALTDEAFASHIEAIKGIVKTPEVKTHVVDGTVLNKTEKVVEPDMTVATASKDEENAKALAAELLAWSGIVEVEEEDKDEVVKVSKKTKVKNKK